MSRLLFWRFEACIISRTKYFVFCQSYEPVTAVPVRLLFHWTFIVQIHLNHWIASDLFLLSISKQFKLSRLSQYIYFTETYRFNSLQIQFSSPFVSSGCTYTSTGFSSLVWAPHFAVMRLFIFCIATAHMSPFLSASNSRPSMLFYNWVKSILTLIFANFVSVSIELKNWSISSTSILNASLKICSNCPASRVAHKTLCILFILLRMLSM